MSPDERALLLRVAKFVLGEHEAKIAMVSASPGVVQKHGPWEQYERDTAELHALFDAVEKAS